MTFRKIISLSIGFSFIVLLVTGILSYLNEYSRSVATLHTVFGIIFSLGVVFHLKNNFRSIRSYSKGKILGIILFLGVFLAFGAAYQVVPFSGLMNFGAKQKSTSPRDLNETKYELIEMSTTNAVKITLDVKRSQHYWHPQMAIWIEDEKGNYVETLFVSKATAKGLFFGGRSKENFKAFDKTKNNSGNYRRVNALPVWSHQRGVKYDDGLYVPTHNNPLPDAITGATIIDNFNLKTSTKAMTRFSLKVEINVAFDDNEYYSEFDFPEDDIFHNGTGQLGQPSIVFSTDINMDDDKTYYLMDLIGHGHHSGQNGEIYSDLSKLTTALNIIERILVSAKNAY